MNTTEKLFLANRDIYNAGADQCEAYTNGMAVRLAHAELKEGFLRSLATNPNGAEPLNPRNSAGHIYGLIRGRNFSDFAAMDTALRLNEASDHFKAACAIIQPLVDRVNELEAELEAEVTAYAVKANALTAAEDAAVEKARLALESDPALAKARLAAEALRPPHIEPPAPMIFREKVDLALTSEAVA